MLEMQRNRKNKLEIITIATIAIYATIAGTTMKALLWWCKAEKPKEDKETWADCALVAAFWPFIGLGCCIYLVGCKMKKQ